MFHADGRSEPTGQDLNQSMRPWRAASVACVLLAMAGAARAESVFQQRPEDGRAIYFTKELGAHADGVTDDSAALQAAIDRARQGIVFVPEGRYCLTKTVYVPIGTRVMLSMPMAITASMLPLITA